MILFTFSLLKWEKLSEAPLVPHEAPGKQQLHEQAALSELPPLWHLLPRNYFWKADFSHSQPLAHGPPSLAGAPWGCSSISHRHKHGFCSPFTHPTTRISAWGCSRFYQCLKSFPENEFPLGNGCKSLSIPIFALSNCIAAIWAPVTTFPRNVLSNTTPKIWPGPTAATKSPSPFGVKSMTKPRWS